VASVAPVLSTVVGFEPNNDQMPLLAI